MVRPKFKPLSEIAPLSVSATAPLTPMLLLLARVTEPVRLATVAVLTIAPAEAIPVPLMIALFTMPANSRSSTAPFATTIFCPALPAAVVATPSRSVPALTKMLPVKPVLAWFKTNAPAVVVLPPSVRLPLPLSWLAVVSVVIVLAPTSNVPPAGPMTTDLVAAIRV